MLCDPMQRFPLRQVYIYEAVKNKLNKKKTTVVSATERSAMASF